MKLNKLSLRDKAIFAKFLSLARHELSVYSFESIYIWQKLFDIRWVVMEGSLCVFFKDKIGCFLFLAPLAGEKNPDVLKEVFEIMGGFNKNKEISRIENIEEGDLGFYQDKGYDCRIKSFDYLCARSDLVNLKGNTFKAKRACVNYFIKNYKFEYLPFSIRYRDTCLKLYNSWSQARKAQHPDVLYQGMLQDCLRSLEALLDNYSGLNLVGRVVKIDREIKGFSFGFKLNQNTFCILYEITDLSIKGLAQFIFRELCRELADYRYINIMDDSGLENLKKVKLSYHPIKLTPAYIAKRNH